jgi:hypothetical protein
VNADRSRKITPYKRYLHFTIFFLDIILLISYQRNWLTISVVKHTHLNLLKINSTPQRHIVVLGACSAIVNLLNRLEYKREHSLKMDLWETAWEGVDSVQVAQDRDQKRALVNTVMNHRIP